MTISRRNFIKGAAAALVAINAPIIPLASAEYRTLRSGLIVRLDPYQDMPFEFSEAGVSINPIFVKEWGDIVIDENDILIRDWHLIDIDVSGWPLEVREEKKGNLIIYGNVFDRKERPAINIQHQMAPDLAKEPFYIIGEWHE